MHFFGCLRLKLFKRWQHLENFLKFENSNKKFLYLLEQFRTYCIKSIKDIVVSLKKLNF